MNIVHYLSEMLRSTPVADSKRLGIIYGSVQSSKGDADNLLRAAVSKILHSNVVGSDARSLWRMSYTSRQPASYPSLAHSSAVLAAPRVVLLPTRPHDISLQDETLQTIDKLWAAIMESEVEAHAFLRFDEREQEQDAES